MVQVSRPEQRSLFDPEVMEECRTVPTATLADTYQQTSPKLNEHLASGDVVLAQKMQRRPLPHLQGNIGLNDRFLYTRELFHSRPHDYQRALEKLDACNDLASARAYVEEELGWNMEQPAAKKFMLLLERRFADE